MWNPMKSILDPTSQWIPSRRSHTQGILDKSKFVFREGLSMLDVDVPLPWKFCCSIPSYASKKKKGGALLHNCILLPCSLREALWQNLAKIVPWLLLFFFDYCFLISPCWLRMYCGDLVLQRWIRDCTLQEMQACNESLVIG